MVLMGLKEPAVSTASSCVFSVCANTVPGREVHWQTQLPKDSLLVWSSGDTTGHT